MATKASDQITIIDLTDGYTVSLSLDAVSLNGHTTTLGQQQQITINVSAYRGAEKITPTVGTPTCPSTVTASVGAASSMNVPVTITFAAALNAAGQVSIPVTVDEVTIVKQFSYSISFKGTSVTVSTTQYQAGTSNTTAPTGTWSNSPVSVPQGQYLWTKVTYSDGSYAYSVARQGTNGTNGTNGTSVTVTSTAYAYQLSTSGTTVPTGTWSNTPVAPTATQYAWTRTTTTFSDNSTAGTYTVGGKTGQNGAPGADAITIVITSSGGVIFKNTSIATTLTAHIYRAGAEITAATAGGTIRWYKDGGSTAVASGATLTISAGDVTNKATYEARLETT